jgi:2-polyprenyl-3-methyl-5-hydroxy-6-metoxy-1,4-benzoquinol methylase
MAESALSRGYRLEVHKANGCELMSVRFDFGKNWRDYSARIDSHHLEEATKSILDFVGRQSLEGKSFLDIGCGSGLHSAAAALLGARVTAVDLDPISVSTTQEIFGRFCRGITANIHEASVFDLSPENIGRFDTVYSWGVLHHTGDLERAIRQACALVTPGGTLAIAIYKKSWLCGAWRAEKHWYSERASARARVWAKRVYISAWRVNLAVKGIQYKRYVEEYRSARGMTFENDVVDWLGGWPYESATREQIESLITKGGEFTLERCNVSPSLLFGRTLGLFGTRCDEFVFRRRAS